METKALKEALVEIQRLMQDEEQLDAEGRALLDQLRAQMGALLDQPKEARSTEDRQTLLDLMRDNLEVFEGEHQRLLKVVGRVVDALNSMGF